MQWPLSAPRGPLDVLGVGRNTVDHLCVTDAFPHPDSNQRLRAYEVEPGGTIPTALVALRRWGAGAAYAGVFGDDEGARVSRASLADHGVDVSAAVARVATPNATSIILVDARSGTRTQLVHDAPRLHLAAAEVTLEQVQTARAVLLDGTSAPAAVAVMAAARAARIPTIADVDGPFAGMEEFLDLVDVLIMPSAFALHATRTDSPETALATLARRGHSVVAITLGAAGALACVGEECVRVPGLAVPAVDPTGAGAVFCAGVAWGLLDGLGVEATFRLANAAAALQCTRLGTCRAIPSLAQARALAAASPGAR